MNGMRTGYDPVIFDLDGTVVDTVELIRSSFRHASEVVLGRVLPDEVLMAHVGQPLMEQMVLLSPEHSQELYDAYREHNHRVHDELIREYAGVEEALAGLREAGKRLALVTSKSAYTTEMAFRAVGLHRYFDVIVTADDTSEHKPKPTPILLALERLGSGPEAAIYVGDSPYDIEAGRAAGTATAAVTWGIFSRADLERSLPTHVLSRPQEIVALCVDGVSPSHVETDGGAGRPAGRTA
jgi:pyrophosphatase PpaX